MPFLIIIDVLSISHVLAQLDYHVIDISAKNDFQYIATQ